MQHFGCSVSYTWLYVGGLRKLGPRYLGTVTVHGPVETCHSPHVLRIWSI